jgi:hypothetical protein
MTNLIMTVLRTDYYYDERLRRSINSLEYKMPGLRNVRMIEVKYISQNQNTMIEDLIIDF